MRTRGTSPGPIGTCPLPARCCRLGSSGASPLGHVPSCPQHTEVTNPRLGSLWALRGVTACCGDPADLTRSQAQGGRISPLARSMFANTQICDLDACPPNPSSWRCPVMRVPSCAGTTCRPPRLPTSVPAAVSACRVFLHVGAFGGDFAVWNPPQTIVLGAAWCLGAREGHGSTRRTWETMEHEEPITPRFPPATRGPREDGVPRRCA